MKEKLTAFFIIILFAAFSAFHIITTNRKTVLNIITPVMFQIDLNNNHIVDDNETICIPKITAFTSNLSAYSEEIKGIPFEKGIGIGYLADEFAHKHLDGKDIKIKFTGEQNSQCRFAEIYTEKGAYSKIFADSGFAIIDGKAANKEKFDKINSDAEKLNLVIYNHSSGKFHKPTCKYGQIAHDAVVLLRKDLPDTSDSCKFCHVKPKETDASAPQLPGSPNIITNGNLKIIFTDFTKILKPDKNCSHAVCRELVSLIDSSTKSIDIALYGWTNVPRVKQAVENAKSRGVKIRVVYDTKTYGENYYPDTESFVKQIENRRSDRIENNAKLTNFLMHNKFVISDNKKVFTGSMNFSETGLSGFNQNNIVIIDSPAAAKIYEKEFEQMYGGKFHTLKIKTESNNLTLSDGSKISILFSPQDKGITTRVVPLVNSAKTYIYIPAFLITHKALTNSLTEAYKRGVDVRLIIDAANIHTRNSSVLTLRAAGIPLKAENYAGKMHSKVMIIDDKYVITGSTNFSNSGENKNDENMLIIENPRIAKFYKDFFLYLWSKIPDKYLKFNPPAESKYSIGSCSDGVDNDFDGKIDSEDEGCR